MKNAKNLEIIEHCFVSGDPDEILRQALINKLSIKIFAECDTEEEAFHLFLWKTADLEPPINNKELLYLRSLGRMYYEFGDYKIENMEKVFEILNISKEKMQWPREDLLREAKVAYWQQYNELTGNLMVLFLNARELVMKKKAFKFLCD